MRDLGKMGELDFEKFCTSEGLIANRSEVDKSGWDYVVEFPLPELKKHSTSVHEAAYECKFQVKSTDTRDRKLAIKLSNLLRLATSPLPSFYIFLEYDKSDSPQNWFIIHINEEWIKKILKRTHASNQSVGSKPLHKQTITINYNNSHKIEKLSGSSLRKKITSFIGPSMGQYTALKKRYLEEVGYEEGKGEIIFSMQGSENREKLLNSIIGKTSNIPVNNVVYTQSRFGIKCKEPFLEFSDGHIAFTPQITPVSCTLTIKEIDSPMNLRFDAKLYTAPPNSGILRCRIVFSTFEWLLTPGNCSIKFNIDEQSNFDLYALYKSFNLIRLLYSSKKDLELTISTPENPFHKLQFTGKEEEFEYAEALQATEEAINIVKQFDEYLCVQTNLRQLDKFHQSNMYLNKVLNTNVSELSLIFNIKEKLSPHDQITCITVVSTTIGNHMLCAFCCFIGFAKEHTNNQYLLEPSTLTIEDKRVFNIKDTETPVKITNILSDSSKKHLKDNHIVIQLL